MRSLIKYFIKYEIAANLLMFALLGLGIFGLFNMKSTFFPEQESRIIQIELIYPGASPEEIEEGVINKIEENLVGVTGIERSTSVSRENSGTVTVEVLRDYSTDDVFQDVQNAVDQISSFPARLEPPVVYIQENLGFAISFALTGDVDLKTLKRFGRTVEEDLRAIDGISKVELGGFPDEEIEIAFRERDLRAYGLTFQEATTAIRNANLEVTGGTLKGEEEELLVRADNKSYYADGLLDIVVKTNPNGGVVRLYEIADVRDRWADNPNRNYLNGKPSVVVTVQNTIEEDIIGIVDKVKTYLDDFNAENQAVQAQVIRDGSVNLRQRIDLLFENGVLGFMIVLLLLAMFLNWRLAFWVALAIPISLAGMLVCANLLDVSINIISLFGMILVIGILVDDGIVIGESIYQEYEKGVPRFKAAVEGTMKVLPAVFSAILTTVIAFSTFFFIDGTLGDFFSSMAIVVIFSLVFSLVEGAFILPAHVAHSKALDPDKDKNVVTEKLDNFMNWMRDKVYGPALRFSMNNGFLSVAIVVGLLVITVGAIQGGIIRGTFFPVVEPDNISVTLQLPAGTREHITEKWLKHIEDAAWEVNEEMSEEFFNGEKKPIEQIQRNIGPTTYQGTISISLIDGEARDTLATRQVTNAIRQRAGEIPIAEVLTYGSATPFGKPISVSLVGNNPERLDAAANELKNELQSLTELADVVDNNQEGLREINIELKEKARYLGLNLQDVVGQVRSGFFGSEVQRLQRGRDEVRVWVRYDEDDRSRITQLEDMRVRFSDGREFPLSEIANLTIERGVIAINHIDGKREIKVEADVARDDVSVSEMTEAVKSEIVPSILKDYPSVSALYEGQNREQEKTAQSLQTVLPIVLVLMLFSIALTFRSIGQTLCVFLLIPFAFIGVGWGHWLMSTPISFLSILGLIALVGILVNDALVFVTTYNSMLEEGQSQMEALYETGVSRFRPILLTTLTTFAGLAPLLFEKSLQAQFLIPMAISVSFGLLIVTLVILLILPVLLIFTNRFKVYASYAWNGVKPSLEAVEPATKAQGGYGYVWFLVFALAGLFALFSFVL